jgi:hypothetical protein
VSFFLAGVIHAAYTDTDLGAVVDAWPDLPEAIKRAVLALVSTVRPAGQ